MYAGVDVHDDASSLMLTASPSMIESDSFNFPPHPVRYIRSMDQFIQPRRITLLDSGLILLSRNQNAEVSISGIRASCVVSPARREEPAQWTLLITPINPERNQENQEKDPENYRTKHSNGPNPRIQLGLNRATDRLRSLQVAIAPRYDLEGQPRLPISPDPRVSKFP